MNKNKKILTIAIGIMLLIIAGVFVLKTSKKDVNSGSKDIEVIDSQDEVENYLANLTLDYKADLEDEYVLDLKDEKVTVNIKNIVPGVNTGELGQTKHVVNIDDKEITLMIDIVDNRTIELSNASVETKVGTSLDKLNKQIYVELILDNLENVKYEINTDNLDLGTPGESEVDLFVYYADNEDNNANIKVKVVVIEDADLDRSDVVEQPRPEDPKSEVKPDPKPEPTKPTKPEPTKPVEPKPVEPKPVEPKPVEPKPEQPKPEQPKPEQPKPDTGKAKYPLTNPSSIPSGAKLTESIVNAKEELNKYNYSATLSGKGSITNVVVSFSDIVGKEVRIDGKDANGDLLFYIFNISDNKAEYEWRVPELTTEDISLLKKIAKQFASAYGQ